MGSRSKGQFYRGRSPHIAKQYRETYRDYWLSLLKTKLVVEPCKKTKPKNRKNRGNR